MKPRLSISLLIALTSIAAVCGSADSASGSATAAEATDRSAVERPAMAMRVVPPSFTEPQLATLKTNPPTFELVLKRDMPTPGWKIEIDAVHVDTASRRITVEATEVAPGGITSQVITPTTMRIPLGTVDRGRYFFELWLRRDKARPYQPAGGLVVVGS